jgi:hypothetical protein
MTKLLSFLALALLLGGCARSRSAPGATEGVTPRLASAHTVGGGTRFRPRPTGALVARGLAVDRMRCTSPTPVVAAAHLELFAGGHVVEIPAGIGVAPPLVRHGAYVRAGRCAYPLRTVEPTGVLLLASAHALTLGQVFDVWGEPLGDRQVAGFTAPRGGVVSVYIDGARWRGDPRSAPVVPGTQIAVEVGPHVVPHSSYTFPPLASLAARA